MTEGWSDRKEKGYLFFAHEKRSQARILHPRRKHEASEAGADGALDIKRC